jgi:hypothetical protein
MSNKTQNDKGGDDQPKKVVRQSSAYERRVGEVLIEVVNTKQRPNDVPKTYRAKKWVVVARAPTKSGAIRTTKIGSCDRKYDAIDVLLNHEIALKAAAKKAADDNKS